MKLNNKGFAISSIMYVIMIMCVILILLTLSILSSRKLILDKQKSNVVEILYSEKKVLGPNAPLILDGLVPVIYSDDTWIVADTKDEWYDYEKKEWANAVLLKTEVTKRAGDSIDIATDVQAMFVWIPKYEYKIVDTEIEINFIDASKVIPTSGYTIHPAFSFDNKNLTGIWVGKFETTGTITNPTILPNQISLTPTTISIAFATAQSMMIDGLDAHMAKNIEWGAISYLTQSKYGYKEMTSNSCSEYKTGMGNSCSVTYEKAGNKSSTTGNITGIYDMNGGRNEYVMAVLNKTIASSGFQNLSAENYFDNYASAGMCNGDICYGDALGETVKWNTGASTFATTTQPWIIRDSLYGYLSGNGATSNTTFRIVLTKA